MSIPAAGRFYKAFFSLVHSSHACQVSQRRSITSRRVLHAGSSSKQEQRDRPRTGSAWQGSRLSSLSTLRNLRKQRDTHKLGDKNGKHDRQLKIHSGKGDNGRSEAAAMWSYQDVDAVDDAILLDDGSDMGEFGSSGRNDTALDEELEIALRARLESHKAADETSTAATPDTSSSMVTQTMALPGRIAALFPHLHIDGDPRQGHIKIRRLQKAGNANDRQDVELSGHPNAVKYASYQLSKFVDHEWALLRKSTGRTDDYETEIVDVGRTLAEDSSSKADHATKRDNSAAKPSLSGPADATRLLLRSIVNPVFLVTAHALPSSSSAHDADDSTQDTPVSHPDAGTTPDIDLSHCVGATISSFTSITLHPRPIISFNLHRRSQTYRAITAAHNASHMKHPRRDGGGGGGSGGSGGGDFSVHALADNPSGQALAELFADPAQRARHASLAGVAGLEDHRLLSVPAVAGSGRDVRFVGNGVLARLACRLRPEWTVSIGDKKVVFAEVLAVMRPNTAALAEGRDAEVETSEEKRAVAGRSLAYVAGSYVTASGLRSAVPGSPESGEAGMHAAQ